MQQAVTQQEEVKTKESKRPNGVTDLGEKYLVAAMAAAVSVSVHFQDGEVIDGRIVHVGTYTIMIENEDNERTLVYKNAVKKIGKSKISN